MENSSSYQYSPLAPRQLRLLRPLDPSSSPNNMCFEISHISREATQPYTAVSYTWGDLQPTETIRLNGKLFCVRPNLLSCLYYLSKNRRKAEFAWTWIWVDAICINQEDDREKSEQVALMSRTYTEARTISVWLGLVSVPGSETFPQDSSSCQGEFSIDPEFAFEHASSDWHDHFDDLLKRPYWSRVWVIQEFLHARKIYYYCSENVIDSEDFDDMFKSESGIWGTNEYIPEDFNKAVNNAGKKYMASSLILARYRAMHQHEAPSLYDYLIRHRRAKCKDRRDHVFALLSLLKVEEHFLLSRFLPNYALDADQVVVIALAHMMNYQWYDHEDITPDSDDIFQALGVEGGRKVRKYMLARAEQFDYDGDWDYEDIAQTMSLDKISLREGNIGFADRSGGRNYMYKSLGLLAFLAITGGLALRHLRSK